MESNHFLFDVCLGGLVSLSPFLENGFGFPTGKLLRMVESPAENAHAHSHIVKLDDQVMQLRYSCLNLHLVQAFQIALGIEAKNLASVAADQALNVWHELVRHCDGEFGVGCK
ncbi:MAG: hypothetical protein CMF66_08620 [Magnetovibrio sp.]|nr:hypothetical protein [Magnetovibrio sp.]